MNTRLLCPECHGDRFVVDGDNEDFDCFHCGARGWVVGEPDAEVSALRARVRELEGAMRDRAPTDAEVEAALRAWYGTTGPDVLKAWDKEVPEADRAVRRKWMAAALTAAYALIPAPAPGRDTTGGTDAA